MVLNEKTFEEIFQYLENSMKNLGKEAFENLEFGEMTQIEEFLQSQFDIRLENLLVAKQWHECYVPCNIEGGMQEPGKSIFSTIEKNGAKHFFDIW